MDEPILKKMTISKCTYVSHPIGQRLKIMTNNPNSGLSEWLLVQINTCQREIGLQNNVIWTKRPVLFSVRLGAVLMDYFRF